MDQGFHDLLASDFKTSDPAYKFPVSAPGPEELHETPKKNMICSFDKIWSQRLLEIRNTVSFMTKLFIVEHFLVVFGVSN